MPTAITMNTRLLMIMHVNVATVLNVAAVPHGIRRSAPLRGGTFEGPRLRGTISPASADWQESSGRLDSNQRPSGPEPDALPG